MYAYVLVERKHCLWWGRERKSDSNYVNVWPTRRGILATAKKYYIIGHYYTSIFIIITIKFQTDKQILWNACLSGDLIKVKEYLKRDNVDLDWKKPSFVRPIISEPYNVIIRATLLSFKSYRAAQCSTLLLGISTKRLCWNYSKRELAQTLSSRLASDENFINVCTNNYYCPI